MRSALYWISIASCGLLSYLFAQRGQYAWSVVLAVVGIAYVVRMVATGRRERREAEQRRERQRATTPTRDEARQLVDGLVSTRSRARSSRSSQLVWGIMAMAAASLFYPSNGALGIALALFVIPVLWLVAKNTRIIWEIDRGLERHASGG